MPAAGGGLIERIRIRSRTRLDEVVGRGVPRRGVEPLRRRDGRDHAGKLPVAMTSTMPRMNPARMRVDDHPDEQLPVVALLAEAGLRVGIRAARDVRRLEALGSGDPRASRVVLDRIGRQRPGARLGVVGHGSIMAAAAGPRRTRASVIVPREVRVIRGRS